MLPCILAQGNAQNKIINLINYEEIVARLSFSESEFISTYLWKEKEQDFSRNILVRFYVYTTYYVLCYIQCVKVFRQFK